MDLNCFEKRISDFVQIYPASTIWLAGNKRVFFINLISQEDSAIGHEFISSIF